MERHTDGHGDTSVFSIGAVTRPGQLVSVDQLISPTMWALFLLTEEN